MLVSQTSQLTKALNCQLVIRFFRVNAETTIHVFAGDEFKEGFMESRDSLAVNSISSRDYNGSKPANKMFNINTFA
jgi:hypothetical protein